MKSILTTLFYRAGDLADVQPVLALFLGAALVAVFLSAQRQSPALPAGNLNLIQTLYRQLGRLLWALLLVSALVVTLTLLRTYLHRTLSEFQRSHGRITEANYNAVQTIWGAEQAQGSLVASLYYEEEITERIESEDLTKPAVTRKKTVRHNIEPSPFLAEQHEVTLKANPRRKGSAFYSGYETECRFSWRLRNPSDRDIKAVLTFPLPAESAMYDSLSAALNGADILPQMRLQDAALVLPRDLKPNEEFELSISFTSRGMSYWYFQIRQAREIRDFTLTLNLPDLPNAKLNYPEGCMSPTTVSTANNGQGSRLTYRLEHAISNKGMGISLPTQAQPGETTNAVLREIERGWLLIFSALALGLTLGGVRHGALIAIIVSAATACVYGLVADFSDLLFGFWGTAVLIQVPLLLVLATLLRQLASGATGRFLSAQMLLYGVLYPCLAGLDNERQSLYFNVCALIFLGVASVQLAGRLGNDGEDEAAAVPANT